MTTNFYFADLPEDVDTDDYDDRSRRFIGKRAAAGLYCWGCMQTLCKGGPDEVHKGRGGDNFYDECPTFYDECPTCGLDRMAMSLSSDGNAVGVELGFAKPLKYRPTEGVAPVSSFTWHIPRKQVELMVAENPALVIRDEYRRELTGAEFMTMVDSNCPIEFTNTDNNWS